LSMLSRRRGALSLCCFLNDLFGFHDVCSATDSDASIYACSAC
jgi:hypothetical protein